MLAKKPEDRYQTPAEVIAALAPWMGNSSRILAGISRTNLAQGADLQATLSEIARGTTKRLHTATVPDVDPDEVDVESGRETGAVKSSKTTREKPRRKKAKAAPDKKKLYIYAAVAVGVSILGVLGAWAISGGSKKPTVENNSPDPVQPGPANPTPSNATPSNATPPKVTPNPNPVTPQAGSTKDVSVFKFDPASLGQGRFRMKGASVVEGQRPSFPRGIAPSLKSDADVSFEVGPVDGVAALTITRHSTALGAQMAFEVERETVAGGMGLKLKPNADYKAVVKYRSTGATQIAFAIHTLSYGSLPGGWRQFGAVRGMSGRPPRFPFITRRRPSESHSTCSAPRRARPASHLLNCSKWCPSARSKPRPGHKVRTTAHKASIVK